MIFCKTTTINMEIRGLRTHSQNSNKSIRYNSKVSPIHSPINTLISTYFPNMQAIQSIKIQEIKMINRQIDKSIQTCIKRSSDKAITGCNTVGWDSLFLKIRKQINHCLLITWILLHYLHQFTYCFILFYMITRVLLILLFVLCKIVLVVLFCLFQGLFQQAFVHELVQQVRCCFLEVLWALQILKHCFEFLSHHLSSFIITIRQSRQQLLKSLTKVTNSNITTISFHVLSSLHFLHKFLILLFDFFHSFQILGLFITFSFIFVGQVKITFLKLIYQFINVLVNVLNNFFGFCFFWLCGLGCVLLLFIHMTPIILFDEL